MIGLRSLARWRRPLAIFPDDVAGTLAGMVARLAPAFDAATLAVESADGELDGFDGIAPRGSYERLLPTEWLLREAVPLEFLRRAANAEQAFFRLARRRPAAPRGSIALFDAGPDQLGVCRIVQLALLVLLTERTERRKEAFGWQLIGHVGDPPFQRFDPNTVRAFLEARNSGRFGVRALDVWRRLFPGRELWLVTGPRLGKPMAPLVNTIEVAESVGPGIETLSVTLHALGRPSRTVILEVPGDTAATRILRDPFRDQVETAPSRLARPDANLLLNPQGSKLFYRNDAGDLIRLHVPNSPRDRVPQAHTHRVLPGTVAAGIGGHGRKLVYLAVGEGHVVMRSTFRLTPHAGSEIGCFVPIAAGGELWPLAFFRGELRAAFVASDRSLWRVDFANGTSKLVAEGVHAVALARGGNALVAVDRAREGDHVGKPAVLEVNAFGTRCLFCPEEPWQRAMLRISHPALAYWALGGAHAEEPQRWEIRVFRSLVAGASRKPQMIRLNAPEGCQVVGLDVTGDSNLDLGLYMLDAERKELFVVGRSRSKTLVSSSSRIERVAVATTAGVVAYTTVDKEIGFVERSGRVRWRGTIA